MSQVGGPGADGDPDEEELRAGARRALPRWVWLLGAVIVVAAATAALVVGLRARDDPTAGPPPTSVRRGPTSPVASLPATPSVAADPCGANRCQFTASLPPAFLEAVRGYFPAVRVIDSRTRSYLRGDRSVLVDRFVILEGGRRRLVIEVRPYVLGPDDLDESRQDIAPARSVRARVTTYGGPSERASVDLTLVEPASDATGDIVVLRLARDPRLAALR